MGVVKKVAPIEKRYSSDFRSLESSLAAQGFYRSPGAFKTLVPFKDSNGRYRTGLDEHAFYLDKLSEEEKEAEILYIRERKAHLEQVTGLDLSSNSQFYNYASQLEENKKVSPVKLGDKDKHFVLDDPFQEISWHWVRVHPSIAPSMQAIQRGDVNPSTVQYYVKDDEGESKITYKRKKELNQALLQLSEIKEPSKLRRLARLMGLPVTENTTEESTYNQLDEALKAGEFKSGPQKGNNPVKLFTELFKMKDERLQIKDYVDQAIASNIYRVRGNDKIYEGDSEIAATKTDLVNKLLDDRNQDELLALEKKLNITKIQALS